MQYDMAPHEIINELNKIKPHTDGVNDVDRRDRAIEAAKDAVRKQIPTTPEPENRIYGHGKCPRCGAFFMNKDTRYCGNCGQALDWSERILTEATERLFTFITKCVEDGYSFAIDITQGKAFVNCTGPSIIIELHTTEGDGEITVTDPEEAAKRLISLNANYASIVM